MIRLLPYLLVAAATVILSGPPALRGEDRLLPKATSIFSISTENAFAIEWRCVPLVRGDSIAAIGPHVILPAGKPREDVIGSWRVSNLWKLDEPEKNVTYRREVATDGSQIELTVEFRVPSYYAFPEQEQNTYSFTVPLHALDGTTFRARGGRNSRPKETTGKLTASSPDGSIFRNSEFGAGVSFIAFEKDGTPGLVFDFNPSGLSSSNDYGPTVVQGTWTIIKNGQNVHFSFGGRGTTHNGVFASKVRIMEGSYEDYHRLHSRTSHSYYSKMPAIRSWSFGPNLATEKWQQAGSRPYSSESGFGWLKADGIALHGDSSRGVLHGNAQGVGEHHFRIDVPQPGIYILTARVAAHKTAIGPFSLTCNGNRIADRVEVAPGELKTITFSTYSDGRTIELGWSGAWAVSSLAIQTLIYATEDFSFKRGVWLVSDAPAPTTLHQFSPAMPPTQAVIESTRHVAHPTEEAVRNARLAPPKTVDRADIPGMDWRWSGNITSLGPSNSGSFYEFQTDAKIERRLDELKALGYRVLILNGLHFRISWSQQEDRVLKTIARIVELAHQRDMKIVEHRSSTVIPHQGTGSNRLLDHLDQTLREVDTGQITRGYCLNNPAFQERLWSEMAAWVGKTKSDGLMLDELTFHTKEFCGCTHCRAKFFRDTGIELPTDETDSTFFNSQSRLWALWLEWRNQALGDWSVELVRRIRQVNPDFVLMKYNTPSGEVSAYMTHGQGGGLLHSARSANFIGTEIMSRNVYATYRSNLAYRSIFNSYRSRFGTPIFALVYPSNQPTFAYAGWAMNNMRAQSTWSIAGSNRAEGPPSSYNYWRDNMDIRRARPRAEVAVIYSPASRDFPRYFNHTSDLVGTCEQLDDFHVPYDVLLSDDLNPEKLSGYRLLILPSVCAMSDREVAAVGDYLKNGGRVLALGHTALLDETGSERELWPIGRWLGLRWAGKLLKGPLELEGDVVSEPRLQVSGAVLKIAAENLTDNIRLLARAYSGKANSIAIAEGDIGNGKLLYVAPRLGAANYEPELTIGRKSEYEYDEPTAQLFAKLLRRVQPATPAFEAVSIPREVRVGLYEQREDDQTVGFVHFYNGSGVSLPKGKPIPRMPPKNPFPKLTSDLVFDITLEGEGAVSGELVSPDFPEARPVKLNELGNRRYRVTVSKDDLKVYSVVRLRYGTPLQAAYP